MIPPIDTETGTSLIHLAAYAGEPTVVKWCIKKSAASVNLANVTTA